MSEVQQNNQEEIQLTVEQKNELQNKNEQKDYLNLLQTISNLQDNTLNLPKELNNNFNNDICEIIKDNILTPSEIDRLSSINDIINKISKGNINENNLNSIDDSEIEDIKSLKYLVYSRNILDELGDDEGIKDLKMILGLIEGIGSSNIDDKKLDEINLVITEIFDDGIDKNDIINMQKLQSMLLIAYNLEKSRELKTFNISDVTKKEFISDNIVDVDSNNKDIDKLRLEIINYKKEIQSIEDKMDKIHPEKSKIYSKNQINILKLKIGRAENIIMMLKNGIKSNGGKKVDLNHNINNTQELLDKIYSFDKEYGNHFNEKAPTLGKFLDSVVKEIKGGLIEGDLNSLGGSLQEIFGTFEKIEKSWKKVDITNPSSVNDFLGNLNILDGLNFGRFAFVRLINLLPIGIKEFKNYYIKSTGPESEQGVLIQMIHNCRDEIKDSDTSFSLWKQVKSAGVDIVDTKITMGLTIVNGVSDALLDFTALIANAALIPDQILGNMKNMLLNINFSSIIEGFESISNHKLTKEEMIEIEYAIVYIISYTLIPVKLPNFNIGKILDKLSSIIGTSTNKIDKLLGKPLAWIKSTENYKNIEKGFGKLGEGFNKIDSKIRGVKSNSKKNEGILNKLDRRSGQTGKLSNMDGSNYIEEGIKKVS